MNRNGIIESIKRLNQEQTQEFFYQLNEEVGNVDSHSPAWIKEFAIVQLVCASDEQLLNALSETINVCTY